MFILITILFLFAAALALAIFQIAQPNYRFGWLVAAGGSVLAWAGVLLWQVRIPIRLQLPAWDASGLFANAPAFVADQFSWPYALALVTLGLAVIISATARDNFPALFPWAGSMALVGFGLLALLADNPLTLVLVWAAIDLTELVSQITASTDAGANERVVAGFTARLAGIGALLWAGLESMTSGAALDFQTTLPQAGIFLILAAGLRLGVLPLHLGFSSDTAARRGFGTTLRLVSAASSLVVLARIPAHGISSPLTPYLLALTSLAGLYAAWMWMRSPDSLTGRPYWVIAFASLALAAALRGNPAGSVGWGVALILAGSALFLASVQNKILNRVLLFAGLWGMSALPFSPSARGWESSTESGWAVFIMWPALLLAQSMLMTGFIRHVTHPAASNELDPERAWARNLYPVGIGLPLAALVLLGLFGWDGARALGLLPAALTAGAFTLTLLWLTPRLRWLNPVRAHWVRPQESPTSRLDTFYESLWNIYRALGRFLESITAALEGDSGILWSLLFLVLFISLLTPKTP